MKKIIISVIITLISLLGVYTVSNAAEVPLADFSNAKIEDIDVTKNTLELIVSDIEATNLETKFFWTITSDQTKPEFDVKTKEGFKVATYNKEKKQLEIITGVEDYYQLNQDMYLWIVEKYYDTNDYNAEKFVYCMEGKKIERAQYYKDYRLFKDFSGLSYINSAIAFKMPWGLDTQRNFNVKIGKVTDNKLLLNLKDKKENSFEDLLTYAKNNKTIFDKSLTSNKSYGYVWSDTDNGTDGKIDLYKDIEDGAYYFLYVEFDNENGKYAPVEGVTILNSKKMTDGSWYMYAYGNSTFKWGEIANKDTAGNTITDGKKEDDKTKDPTVSPTKLPNTGEKVTMLIAIAGVATIGVILYRKNKEYKDVK